MPADPQVGNVFRAENVTGVVFEEIVVKAIDQMVNGPRGPVTGAVIMEELHLDGSVSDKVFAPGYGEFDSSHGEDVEALALALDLTLKRSEQHSIHWVMLTQWRSDDN